MPAFTASAPGKIILFGEHAVVYGQPAIAVPVSQTQARAIVTASLRQPAGSVLVQAPDIGLESALADLPPDHPLAAAIQGVFSTLAISKPPALTVRITSTIPVAAGLGSGASVSIAVIRALSAFLGHPLADEQVSALAYEVEKLHHGTPSGIDNTVITWARPVFFVRGQDQEGQRINTIEPIQVPQPFTIVIADTGIPSPTANTVSDVRRAWQAAPERFNSIFQKAGRITRSARRAIESGQPLALGPLMDENHALLREMGVSSSELDRLVQAARSAGALGAKLSGGGGGGNLISLVSGETAPELAQALQSAGATRTIITTIG
jgi:mevalonate kinase